jgi:hypothetical protein
MENQIKIAKAAERKAWNTMMRGSAADASTVWGHEGKNTVAWQKAAEELRQVMERL